MPSVSSFINANNMSAENLGVLLLQLTNNEIEYNKYFAYQSQPLSLAFQNITLLSYAHPNVLCRLCDHAVQNRRQLQQQQQTP